MFFLFSARGALGDPVVVAEPLDVEDRAESGEPAEGAPLWLAVTGQETLSVGAVSTGIVVAIGGAFDQLAAPRRLRAKRKHKSEEEEAFDAFDDPRDAPPRAEPAVALASDVGDPRADDGPPPIVDGTFARGLVRAAMRVAKRGQARDRLDGLATRAKVSALLPEVRFRVGQNVDQIVALAPTVTDPQRTTASDGAKLLLEGRATFKLDRLVFADEEVQIEKLRLEREHVEKALVNEVLRRLEAWQRAELASRDPTVTGDAAIEVEVQSLAASAALDVLTDGWFSAHLSDLRSRSAPAVSHDALRETEKDAPRETRHDEERAVADVDPRRRRPRAPAAGDQTFDSNCVAGIAATSMTYAMSATRGR